MAVTDDQGRTKQAVTTMYQVLLDRATRYLNTNMHNGSANTDYQMFRNRIAWDLDTNKHTGPVHCTHNPHASSQHTKKSSTYGFQPQVFHMVGMLSAALCLVVHSVVVVDVQLLQLRIKLCNYCAQKRAEINHSPNHHTPHPDHHRPPAALSLLFTTSASYAALLTTSVSTALASAATRNTAAHAACARGFVALSGWKRSANALCSMRTHAVWVCMHGCYAPPNCESALLSTA